MAISSKCPYSWSWAFGFSRYFVREPPCTPTPRKYEVDHAPQKNWSEEDWGPLEGYFWKRRLGSRSPPPQKTILGATYVSGLSWPATLPRLSVAAQ